MSLSVVLADPHAAARAGVRAVLAEAGMAVLAECADAATVVAACREHRPDLCLLAIALPGGGVAAAAQIVAAGDATAVVVLTASENETDLFAAVEAGVDGYLLKDTDPERLAAALQGVLRGEAAMQRHLVRALMREFRRRALGGRLASGIPGAELLTDREWAVYEALVEGMTTRQVAERLGISEVTVRRHTSEAVRKLGQPDRRAAVALAGRPAA